MWHAADVEVRVPARLRAIQFYSALALRVQIGAWGVTMALSDQNALQVIASASTQKRTGKCSEVGQASSRAHVKGSLLMQNRKENAGKIGTHRGVAAVMVY